MSDLWMVDLEGTLTDNAWRQHLITGEKKDWRTYYKGLEQDDPITEILDLVCILPIQGHRVLIYSTRMPNKYDMERKWLAARNLSNMGFIQRKNTQVPGHELVREWVIKYKPTHLIDDRDINRGAVIDLVPHIYSPADLIF